MTQDEEDRITENIDAVYAYLGEEFKGWRITKQAHSSDVWQRQKFTVLNLKEDKTFTLFVSRATLSDVRTTGKMAHELQAGKVAEGMRRAGENGYYWP